MTAPIFRRLLVGFDGSPDATEAVRAATALLARDGGHVVALAVVARSSGGEDGSVADDEGRGLRTLAEACFAETLRTWPPGAAIVRTSVQVVVADGASPAQVVTNYAVEHGYDMLVLGRRGESGGRGSRLGRVAETAVHLGHLPVLLLSSS